MALQSFEDNSTMRNEITGLLEAVSQTMQSYQQQNDAARYKGSIYRTKILDDLLASFAHLGMSQQQEEEILEMVRDRTNKLTDLYDISGETQATFGALSQKLTGILGATEDHKTLKSISE
jgi:hypothetical protein